VCQAEVVRLLLDGVPAMYPGYLDVLDVHNSTNLAVTGGCTIQGTNTAVAVQGNRAYVTDANGGLTAVDITNPKQPVVVETLALPSLPGVLGIGLNSLSGHYA
jgi:hypothetical protein